MIVKVDSSLERKFWEYVSNEETINLFIIGDVESYGFDTDFQDVWSQIEDDKITSVMLRYYNSLIIYSYENNFDIDEMIEHINLLEVTNISGKKSVIDRLIFKYKDYKDKKETLFYSLKKLNDIDFLSIDGYEIEKAKISDLENIFNFLSGVEGFISTDYIESKTHQLKTNSSRLYFIKENEKIINTVSTAIETSFLAMVAGVATDKEYRNKELASYSVYKLSKELLLEGKMPCLFCNNPIAKRLYERIGYKQENNWTILSK